MYAVTKTYKDFNGVERTETKLFNLTETEVMEMELGTAGGVAEMLQRIVDAKDQPTIIKFFKEFILKAYGEKSADGTYFEKSEEISRKFACTQFYNLLFMELATDDSKAAEFVNHVIPKVVDIKKHSENPERNQRFIPVKEQKLRLEHSLVSLSKWESKWCKVFLSKEQKTIEETIDYIRCMTLTQNVDPLVYQCITNSHIDAVNAYIEAPMTASTVKEEKGGPINRQQITSELIYYWMTAYHIPFECQKWHLNRLLMLIRICNAENKPPKKRSKRDLYRHHAEVNAANRKKFNSKG